MLTQDLIELAERLDAPFGPDDVKFKPQTVNGNRALAVAYLTARAVMDRLDDVLGVVNWADQYELLPGGSVKCTLSIRFQGEWVAKEDVGSPSEQPDEGDRMKAAYSDSLKRAAVKFGIGRALYRAKPQWCDFDPQKRQFVRTPAIPSSPRASFPTSAQLRQPQPTATVIHNGQHVAGPAPTAPPPAHTVLDVARAYDAKLAKDGVSDPGALIAYLEDQHGQQWSALKDKPAGPKGQRTQAGARAEELLSEYAKLQRDSLAEFRTPTA